MHVKSKSSSKSYKVKYLINNNLIIKVKKNIAVEH